MDSHTVAIGFKVFLLVCLVSQVVSVLYCFTCFGYDQDGPKKCESRKNLTVRRCPEGESAACIKYTAKFLVPELIGDKIWQRYKDVHGFHCGTKDACESNACPDHWNPSGDVKDCKITCCDGSTESCPVPTAQEVADHVAPRQETGKKLAQGKVGARGAVAVKAIWSDWLKVLSAVTFAWFKLY